MQNRRELTGVCGVRRYVLVGGTGEYDQECGERMAGTYLLFFTLITGPRRSLSLKLSDKGVYEPQI